jgi:hypothetical protein
MLRLRFDQSEIGQLEQGYLQRAAGIKDGGQVDRDAEAAGARIRDGDRTKTNLDILFRWKHSSSRFLATLIKVFDSNSPERVTAVLNAVHEIVESGGDAGDAVTKLVELNGVAVPTASAFLANIYPEKFTVIDILALRSLGVDDPAIAFYRYYNSECLRLAKENNISMRTLDRALWEWGKTNSPRKTTKNSPRKKEVAFI